MSHRTAVVAEVLIARYENCRCLAGDGSLGVIEVCCYFQIDWHPANKLPPFFRSERWIAINSLLCSPNNHTII